MGNLIEYLIVGLLLLWSCSVVLRNFMPKTVAKWQQAVAQYLAKHGFIRASGFLTPKAAVGGCASGCSGCPVKVPAKDQHAKKNLNEQPVQWR